MIREPVPGRIDFVHRTVQEYLAAAQAADDADVEPLIARAHLDQWRETVVMAAGHANAPLRGQLLTGLLDRADAEPRHSHRLRLLIAACLETIPDVPTGLRDRVDTCIAGLIPPRNAAEARPLASAGEEMLGRLPANLDSLSTGEAVATVRTAWLINGSQALDRLAQYASEPRTQVQDELVTGWSYFDPREYARRVLADAPLHNGRLTVDDPNLLPGVPLLRHLHDLRVKLPKTADLDCLEGLPALTELEAQSVSAARLPALAEHTGLRTVTLFRLKGLIDDVSPLMALPKLRVFAVYTGQSVSDLSFIARLPKLSTLALPGLTDVEDFTPLTSQPALKYLFLYGCKNLTGIEALHSLPALRGLTLAGASLPADSMNEIVKTWPHLRMLQLADADWVTSLDPVTALPLDVLHIGACPGLTDIAPITRLQRLRWLGLFETQVSDLRPITGLSRLRTLNLGGRDRVLDLAPVASLPKIRRLGLYNVAEDTDLTPLARMRNLTIIMYENQHLRGIEHLHRSTRIDWQPRD